MINHVGRFLLGSSLIIPSCFALAAQAQITPGGAGTTVTVNGQTYSITGGSQSSDGRNLFHLFRQFGLNDGQIANFMSNPNIRNILAGVNGGNPSYINGLIQVLGGNSNLYLLNPAGVIFGPNAQLNVPAAFHASTASAVHFGGGIFDLNKVNDYTNLLGNPTAFDFTTKGILLNEGSLAVKPGQALSLSAHQVINTGTLSAPGGNVTITAVPESGRVRVSQEGMLLSLEMIQNQIPAAGEIQAVTLPELLTGGQAQGIANSVVHNPDGTISLVYDPNKVNVPMTTATTVLGGAIDVSNPVGVGGNVSVVGSNIALVGSQINASGNTGGGTVLVGGDYLGGTTGTNRLDSSFNAKNLFVDANSALNADALTNGNGGTVINWADNNTNFNGFISARGGQFGGNGGFAEVSGRNTLQMTGFADLRAPQGNFGTLLLDPGSVTIQDGTNTNLGTNSFNDAYLAAQLGLGNVTVATSAATNGNPETITIVGNTNINWSAATTLTLNAGQNIVMNSGAVIQNTSTTTGFNAIVFNANTAGTATGNFSGISLNNGTLTATGGNIQLTGTGGNTNNDNYGISVNGGNITTTNGNILLTGTGGTSTGTLNFGILVQNGANISSTGTGNLTLMGTGRGSGLSLANNGLQLGDSHLSTGSGAILLDGTGGIGGQSNGIRQIQGSSVTSSSGDITYVGSFVNPGSQGIIIQFDNSGVNNIIGNTSGTVTLTADKINLVGQLDIKPNSVSGTSKLIIEPLAASTTIGIGSTGSGTLQLNNTELGMIQPGFSQIIIGSATGSGAIEVAGTVPTFNDNLELRNPSGGGIQLNSALSVDTNNLTLNSGGTVTQDPSAPITASGLELLGTGPFTLDNTSNNISTLAGNTTGAISYTDADAFSVGTVNSTVGLQSPGDISLTTTTGDLTVAQPITKSSGANATLILSAADNIRVNPGANITSTSGALDIIFRANAGHITIGSTISGNPRTELNSNGGLIRLGGGNDTTPANGGSDTGVAISRSDISSGNGSVDIAGQTNAPSDPEAGVDINGSTISSDAGNIFIQGSALNVLNFGGIVQRNNSSVTSTAGDITYTVPQGAMYVSGGTQNTVTSGTGNITLTTNEIYWDNLSTASSGQLLVQPFTATTAIALGTYTSTLNLTQAEINMFTDGFSSITIGGANSSGAITIGDVAFKDNVLIRTPELGGGGTITLLGNLSTETTKEPGSIELLADGAITTPTSVTPYAITTQAGGNITLTGASINLPNFDLVTARTGTSVAGFAFGSTGDVNVTSTTGNIDLNDINTSINLSGDVLLPGSVGSAGLVFLNGPGNLTLGNINSSIAIGGTVDTPSSIGSGGAVTITGDTINVGTITSSLSVSGFVNSSVGFSTLGSGGAVAITGGEITATGINTSLAFGSFVNNVTIGSAGAVSISGDTLNLNGNIISTFTASGGITNSTVGTGGNISLTAGVSATQNSGGLTGPGLELLGAGNFTLNSVSNSIETLAGGIGGSVDFTNSTTFEVGSVNSTTGLTFGGNATLTALGEGDINVNESIIKTTAGTSNLTLQAEGNLFIGSVDIETLDGPLNLTLNSDRNQSNGGGIELCCTSILTNGGNVIMGGGIDPLNTPAIGTDASFATGIYSGALIETNGGFVSIRGQGQSGEDFAIGVELDGSLIDTGSGNVLIQGQGGDGDFQNIGVLIDISTITTETGSITVTGQSSGADSFNPGLLISDSQLTTEENSIALTGIGSGSGNTNDGIYLFDSDISSLISGDVSLTGTGAVGSLGIFSDSCGCFVNNIGRPNSTGNITLTADTMDLSFLTIQGKGNLLIQPLTPSTTIGLGDGTTGVLNLDGTALANIQDGFNLITIGRANGNGLITVGPGDVTFTDDLLLQNPNGGGINFVGNLNVGTNNLTLNSGGNISQTSGGITANQFSVTAPNIDLNSATNDVNALSGTSKGNVRFRDSDGFDVLGISSGQTVTLTAGNTVTQTGEITTNNLSLSGTRFILDNPNNSTNTLTGQTTGNLTFRDQNGFNIAATGISSGGTVTLTAGDTVAQIGVITTNNLNLSGTRFIFNNPNNSTNTLTGQTTGNLTFRDQNGFNIAATGISSGGAITLTAGDTVAQVGVITTNNLNLSGTRFILNNPNNSTNTLTSQTTGNLTFRDQNGFNIAATGISSGGAITLTAGDTVAQVGVITTNNLNLSGTRFILNNPNNSTNTLTSQTTGNLTFRDQNGFNIAATGISSGGTVTLTAGDTVAQAGVITTNNLNLFGTRFILNNPSNSTNTLIGQTTGNLTFRDQNGFNISGISSGGTVALTAGDTVTQTGVITANNLNLSGTRFILNNPNNSTNTLSSQTTGNLTFRDQNGFNISGISSGGSVALVAGDTVTQTGVITANTLSLSGKTFTLSLPGNDVNVLSSSVSDTLHYRDANSVVIGNGAGTTGLNVGNTLILNTTGGITQGATAPVVTPNLVVLGSGNTTLKNNANQIQNIAVNSTGAINVVSQTDLTVANIANVKGIQNSDQVLLRSTQGDIVLNQGVKANTDVTLVAKDNFINNVGSNVFQAGGPWLIYSTTPAGNVNGQPVLGGSSQFNTTYPTPPSFSGNGFVYSTGAP